MCPACFRAAGPLAGGFTRLLAYPEALVRDLRQLWAEPQRYLGSVYWALARDLLHARPLGGPDCRPDGPDLTAFMRSSPSIDRAKSSTEGTLPPAHA